MALTSINGMPLIPVGAAGCGAFPYFAAGSTTTTFNVTGSARMWIGRVVNDDKSGPKTIDTTGSSSIGLRTGISTWSNAGSTADIGLATVDAVNGPPGRAINVSDIITFDVKKTINGGAGWVGSAWNEFVPNSGTKTINNGDLVVFAVQLTVKAGSDALALIVSATPIINPWLGGTSLSGIGGSYAANSVGFANFVITYNDGTRGYFSGACINSGIGNQSFNSGSATNEYGNVFRFDIPTRAYGIYGGVTPSGDFDAILYNDPFGTPSVLASVSTATKNTVGGVSTTLLFAPFATPIDLIANTDYGATLKPTTVSNISIPFVVYNIAAHQNSNPLGTDCYAINRASGAFAAQNSSKDRFAIGLLLGAFDNGTAAASAASSYAFS